MASRCSWARADHASILDGRTLRLSGRIRLLRARSHRPARSAPTAPLEVWLQPHDRPGEQAVRLCAADVDHRRLGGETFAATAALASAGDGQGIGPGDWGVYVREPGAAPIAVGAPPPEADTGPTLLNPRSPETGLWYRLRTSPTGRLGVRVTAFRAYAEVERVGTHLTELAIEGRVVGTTLAASAGRPDAPPVVLRFSQRGGGGVHSVPVRLAGDRFSARADPELFSASGGGRRRWSLELCAPGKEPLVLGRHLDDMREPAATYRYPAVMVGAGSRDATRLLVTYTDNRRLVLETGPVTGRGTGS